MEALISRLKIPFILIIALFIGFLLISLMEAYGNYWMGKYYQSQYEKNKLNV
jgi:hypothetical protein